MPPSLAVASGAHGLYAELVHADLAFAARFRAVRSAVDRRPALELDESATVGGPAADARTQKRLPVRTLRKRQLGIMNTRCVASGASASATPKRRSARHTNAM